MADDDSFAILSDGDQMIGHATVFDRKRVEVNSAGSYKDADALSWITPEMREFANPENSSWVGEYGLTP